MNRLNSNDLLSFDFLHDNQNNKIFFKNNEIYNFNNFDKFKIDKKLLENKIYKKIEEYVKDLMFENFEHENHNILYDYINVNDDIKINTSSCYTLIFDNMQCNMKNILNIQMLLNNPKIYIYIPFILCCENIKINKKNNSNSDSNSYSDNFNYNDEYIKNIQDSYNKLKNKIIINNNIEIIENNFYDNNNYLKEEYIYESLLIGFNYHKNKILNYNNINSFNKINNKTKDLLNEFIDFIKLVNKFNSFNYPDLEHCAF